VLNYPPGKMKSRRSF